MNATRRGFFATLAAIPAVIMGKRALAGDPIPLVAGTGITFANGGIVYGGKDSGSLRVGSYGASNGPVDQPLKSFHGEALWRRTASGYGWECIREGVGMDVVK